MFKTKFASLIDLGSSDNEARKRLLTNIDPDLHPKTIVSTDLHVLDEQTVQVDLERDKFDKIISNTPAPRLILSIFVLQELSNLDVLCASLKDSMQPDDVFIFIIPHPDFSLRLKQEGKMPVIATGEKDNDWEWAGEYPVPVNEVDTIPLPNFYRTTQRIIKIFSENYLTLLPGMPTDLSLPNNKTTKEVFMNTIYEEHILHHPSGIMFAFQKHP